MKKTIAYNILLIERDNSLRESLAELLILNDFRVLTANSAGRALQIAKEQPPDIVICARSFPDGDCSGILLELRENAMTKGIPMIFLSSKPAGGLHQKMLNQAKVLTILKPFRIEDLLEAIQQSLDAFPKFLSGESVENELVLH